ncbi:CgeB family protein [Deefgea piscis]|uniref:CgeB family protein n=1 Tax=Deefgea piscis TaxID=2739061 RepID=UPI001C80C852|nr:glycosyltransferase [Deefgea piscis]QZA81264.1 glycosyltransferase [Deefgea piscis]
MRLALLADELTTASVRLDANVSILTPYTYRAQLALFRPDFLLVESAWAGWRNTWKFGVAAYPDYPKRNNLRLQRLVAYARDRGIPTVFWNKEDGVHFDRFIDSARWFDHVFTVDSNCVAKYKAVMGEQASVHTLMFAIQPRTHGFRGFDFKHHRANFVGSYSHHVHDRRRAWQDMLFTAAADTGLGLTVVDRNSARKAGHYRFPDLPNLQVLPAVPHGQTAQLYRDFLVSLNVNTIEDSPTMFSRRLVEILGCGGIAVTNPTPAVDGLFRDYCHVVQDMAEAKDLFDRLRHGPAPQDLERARAGAEYVLQHHTWAHRLQQIQDVIGV